MNFNNFVLCNIFSLEKNLKVLDLCNKTYPLLTKNKYIQESISLCDQLTRNFQYLFTFSFLF